MATQEGGWCGLLVGAKVIEPCESLGQTYSRCVLFNRLHVAKQAGIWCALLLGTCRWSYGSFSAFSFSIPDPSAHFAVAVCAAAVTVRSF